MEKKPTRVQVSAGGVAFRQVDSRVEIALISVGSSRRWQLPKGQVNDGETTEATAKREVREEAGLETELVSPIETIDYWFYASGRGGPTRIHKYVHFFLLRYLSGDTQDHDHEVNEARWEAIDDAYEMLAFESEKNVVLQAKEMISALLANQGDMDPRGANQTPNV